MYPTFFLAAARSPSRQIAWRILVALHLLIVGGCYWMVTAAARENTSFLGIVLLITGIVEGALLIGWRLTQLPKSRSMEFLLASPLRPPLIFLSEASIGIVRLGLITLTGLPLLLFLCRDGYLYPQDIFPLLVLPWTWGTITGLSLTVWAYEPRQWRRIAERFVLVLVLIYLIVGVMAGEKLAQWLVAFPYSVRQLIIDSFHAFHTYNPFAVIKYALEQPPEAAHDRVVMVESLSLLALVLLLCRAALRMQGHFQERHYSPVIDSSSRQRKPVGVRPLSWWAVKRVSEYSGRVNLWLAGGFGILYALHTLAGDNWPAWMGRKVFEVFDGIFGIAGVATGLVLLSAVPAAFQYGLWDSNTQDRCRRLELLLMTRLEALDYWSAALAAAWKRGYGYFLVAILLWGAAVGGGKMTAAQAGLAFSAGVLLWLLYFSLGFRAFSRGVQANNLGMLLTVGLPLVAIAFFFLKLPALAALTPPGMVYLAAVSNNVFIALPGILLAALLILRIHRHSLLRCLDELRLWYEKYHGKKMVD